MFATDGRTGEIYLNVPADELRVKTLRRSDVVPPAALDAC